MRAAGYTVNETDPFATKSTILFKDREISPHVNRIKMMWQNLRQPIIDKFPEDTGLPKNIQAYMDNVDDKLPRMTMANGTESYSVQVLALVLSAQLISLVIVTHLST